MLRLATELEELKDAFEQLSLIKIIQLNVHSKSLLPGVVILPASISALVILISSILLPEVRSSTAVVSILLFLLIAANFGLHCWDEIKRRREITGKISWLAQIIKDIHADSNNEDIVLEFLAYTDICESNSFLFGPSHSFTMLYQNIQGETAENPVPFPTSLIATGDIIGICPGQVVPCNAVCATDGCITLNKGEVFYREDVNQSLDHSTNQQFLYQFEVLRSPIVEEVKDCLNFDDELLTFVFGSRPKTMLTKNREETSYYIILFLPFLCISILLVGAVWFIYSQSYIDCEFQHSNQTSSFHSIFIEQSDSHYWFELFILTPALIILPLLPITCPVVWILVHSVGEAKTLSRCFGTRQNDTNVTEPIPVTPTTYSLDAILSNSQQNQAWNKTWLQLLLKILFGNEALFSRNCRTFDTLGSLTVLCCVNKEGLLSWYDPAPEKVCFFSHQEETVSSTTDESEEDTIFVPEKIVTSESIKKTSDKKLTNESSEEAHVEILTLSQDSQNSSRLHFDDRDWSKHLPLLKGIGLNILSTHFVRKIDDQDLSGASTDQEQIFCANIIEELQSLYEAQYGATTPQICQDILSQHKTELMLYSTENGYFTPGVLSSKVGLCSLAELIGFVDEVTLLYLPKMVHTVYKEGRILQRNISRKSEESMSHNIDGILNLTISLPYAHGVVINNWANRDQDHLFVAGSGDLILEMCSHYWDGNDIHPLNAINLRKINDFCHRSSIVGHCIAHSCCPLDKKFASKGSSLTKIIKTSDSDLPTNQVFLGMVSMQHQTRVHIFHLIEALESACIRFVHFSPDDEFRARVFAEKMGLEVGWNCHISLSSKNIPSANSTDDIVLSSDDMALHIDETEDNDPSSVLLHKHSRFAQMSESSLSESAFHALNRAKLPRGVENIIPHIENVDNVPLLVPLFTDCQQQSSKKMIEIMQKYGEVVCCIGSSDTINNIPVFAQADISIALQPILKLHENSVEKDFSFNANKQIGSNPKKKNSMNDLNPIFGHNELIDNKAMLLARTLNTFPCSVTLCDDDSLETIYNMIKQARHFLFQVHICLIFYMKCLLMVSVVQLLSHLVHLPLIFMPGDVFWLCYIIIPCLSFSLLGSPRDPDLMTWASVKNTLQHSSSLQLIFQNIKHFSAKFFPTCLVIAFLYAMCIISSCDVIKQKFDNSSQLSNTSTIDENLAEIFSVQCYPQFSVCSNSSSVMRFKSSIHSFMSKQKRFCQQICVCALVLHMCIISITYVHRWKLLINHSPLSNRFWLCCIGIVLVCQLVYSIIVITTYTPLDSMHGDFMLAFSLGKYEPVIWTLFFIWPLPCLIFNEISKWKEIQMWTRCQKRARLAFGTKLGMNSPF